MKQETGHTLDFNDTKFRCIKLLPARKEPLERGWTTERNYAFSSQEIEEWVRKGGNYGLFCPNGDCCFVDADTKEIQTALDDRLPTYWYSTGREGHRQYVYAISNPPIRNIPLKDGAYIKGQNGYAVGPGSIHPNGAIYGLRKSEYPIKIITKEELIEALRPFMVRSNEKKERPQVNRKNTAWLSLADLIDLAGFRHFGNQYQGPHPIHGSETGINLSVDIEKNVWHCFRHDSGGSVLEWIAVSEGIIDCADAVPGTLRGDKFWEVLEVANRKYGLATETVAKMLKGESKHDATR
ncbi:MAG: bifunctional DNA primase/polymerase [Thermoplasmatales archaeon]|nr:bifunctional DNA primase/polymerase [Thermoplasmatales archaeon]